jgi:hypothetical protein
MCIHGRCVQHRCDQNYQTKFDGFVSFDNEQFDLEKLKLEFKRSALDFEVGFFPFKKNPEANFNQPTCKLTHKSVKRILCKRHL